MTTRRKVLIVLGTAPFATPFAAIAQAQGKIRRIGFLWEREYPNPVYVQYLDAFKTGMRDLGYTEGKSYVIEHRSAQNESTRLPALAAELVALKVDVIISSGTPSAVAAHKAAREIPILITGAGNPVGTGLAVALSRPGGNVTGLTQGVGSDVFTKGLDLLRQIVSGMRSVGFLYDPDNASNAAGLRQFEADCVKLELKSLPAPVRKAEDIATTFNTLVRDRAQGLLVANPATFGAWRKSIIEHAARHHLPAAYLAAAYAEAGGLIAYGTNVPELYRRAATYADKIFKGAKPGDLPIEQPTRFELVVNLKTAKALGLTIPQPVLLQATQVIE